MNKCIQKILLAACIVAMPVTTHAGLIDHGTGYTRDSESNVVQGGGLDWLQWDETIGQSINTALGTYAPLGWRLATNFEMAGLFNAFDFGLTFTNQENVSQVITNPGATSTTGPHADFLDLFGRTRLVECPGADVPEGCLPAEMAFALFGSDADDDTYFNLAKVELPRFPTVYFDNVTSVFLDKDTRRTSAFNDPSYSVALVKSTSVPEPGTFALLSLGLLGLGLNRRIHRKTL